ncbi:MAG: AbrB/MazE/SpoVT family DNA-binding domain-containing protein [Pirellulales bacterium]
MKTRIQKWGNSLALRIPKSCAEEAHVTQDSVVNISVEDGALIVRPIEPTRPTLEELLAEVTDSNIHGEVDYGPPTGREAW